MTAPHCPIHPDVTLRCPACAGSKGGQSTSPAKVKAAKRNARKGGRPPGKRNTPKRKESSR